MLSLNVIRNVDKMSLNLTEKDCPIEFNGRPVYRKASSLGMNGAPRSKYIPIIFHPTGLRMFDLADKGYLIMCMENGCRNTGSQIGFKCTKHAESFGKCRSDDCKTAPIYGYIENKSLRCGKHKVDDMIYTGKKCEIDGCNNRPYFGVKGEGRTRCKSHAGENMVNPKIKKCEISDCNNIANYRIKGEIKTRCRDHIVEGMIHSSKCCKFDGCVVQAAYGYAGASRNRCVTHKLEGMILLTNIKCEIDDCGICAIFGFPGSKPSRCGLHRLSGMIDVQNKKCQFVGCNKLPTYGFSDQHRVRCKEHILEGMGNYKHRFCEILDCPLRAGFGFQGNTPNRCKSHMEDGMIDLTRKRCDQDNCDVTAVFGVSGKCASKCRNHSVTGMINIIKPVCTTSECIERATFSYKGQRPEKCKVHCIVDMVRRISTICMAENCSVTSSYLPLYSKKPIHCVKHATLNEYSKEKVNPRCLSLNCNNTAYYYDCEDTNLYPVRCHEHKFDTDIQLVKRKCSNCESSLYFPENTEYCINCGNYRQVKLYHFKESIVKAFLETVNIKFIHDKKVTNGMSRFRPDFQIKSKFGCIALEVDEWGHSNYYDKNKEINRMLSIVEDLKVDNTECKTLFIRYNPDPYVSDHKCHPIDERLKYLYTLLEYFINLNDIGIGAGVVYLYYDGFNGHPAIQRIVQFNKDKYEIEPNLERIYCNEILT